MIGQNANGPPKEAAALARLVGKLVPLSLRPPVDDLVGGCFQAPQSLLGFVDRVGHLTRICDELLDEGGLASGFTHDAADPLLRDFRHVLRDKCHLRFPLSVVDRTTPILHPQPNGVKAARVMWGVVG